MRVIAVSACMFAAWKGGRFILALVNQWFRIDLPTEAPKLGTVLRIASGGELFLDDADAPKVPVRFRIGSDDSESGLTVPQVPRGVTAEQGGVVRSLSVN